MISPAMAQDQHLPRDYGALILRGQTASNSAVLLGSPADKAGLVENDIILEVNGTKLGGDITLSRQLKNFKVGESVSLKIYHKGGEKTVTISAEPGFIGGTTEVVRRN